MYSTAIANIVPAKHFPSSPLSAYRHFPGFKRTTIWDDEVSDASASENYYLILFTEITQILANFSFKITKNGENLHSRTSHFKQIVDGEIIFTHNSRELHSHPITNPHIRYRFQILHFGCWEKKGPCLIWVQPKYCAANPNPWTTPAFISCAHSCIWTLIDWKIALLCV